MIKILLRVFILLGLALQGLGPGDNNAPAAGVTLYGDALASGWEDWSWGGQSHNYANASPVHGGSASIRIQFTGGWSAVQIGTNATPPATPTNNTLEFWINGGASGGQSVQVVAGDDCSSASQNLTLTANTWTKVSLAFTSPGSPTTVKYVYWYNPTNAAQPVFYVDDVALVNTVIPPPAATSGPALAVNANAGRRAISPLIYGMNFPNEALAAELRLPIQRWGGNSTTRYNWQNDTGNRARDWYFENLPENNPNPAQLPNGSASDRFVEQARRTNTQVLLTVPLIGWTPKSRARACGFSISKYGAQQANDWEWSPDCGNGLKPDESPITGNDPADTSVVIDPSFVQSWIQHLIARYGTAAAGGVRFYNLDNEPMLWNDTHRDVHPLPTSYDELRDRTLAYAPAIKASDPGALTVGPALWGWTAYFYSALDAAPGGDWWNDPKDRKAHANLPFVEWYLQQMRTYEQQHDLRILDYFDLHFYPQVYPHSPEIFSEQSGDDATQQLRLRSTRSLWDPSYTDASWIAEPIYLIPRMRSWVNTNYPGTRLAIGEYSWGAMCHISGALAQADALGIFGREGLDLATLWDPPASNQPGAYAFRMFRNVDGSGGSFGDTSVQATSANSERLAVYAAQRSQDGALTVLVINKTTGPLSASLALSGFTPAVSAKAYRYSSTQQTAIASLPNQAISSKTIQATYPAYSITLFVIPNAAGWYQMYVPKIMR
jgi:hypothetical protein